MLNASDLKSGTTFVQDGQMFVVLKYEHTKMGRGGATIKVKVKNLETGSVTEKTFQSGSKVEPLEVQQRTAHYLYQEDNQLVFMNTRDYQQYEIDKNIIGDQKQFLQEGSIVKVLFTLGDREKAVSVELPPKMTFTVTEAAPGIKGDTAANMMKNIKLDNGMTIKAPLFIKTGEKIIVDTRTGEYVERSK